MSVEDPDPLTDTGLKLAVAPEGKPLALRETLPVNPFVGLIFTVYVALFPAVTVPVVGVAEIVKSGGFDVGQVSVPLARQ